MRWLIALSLILLTMACSPIATTPLSHLTEFKVTDSAGHHKIISAQHSQWRLINFWATWCQPCRTEMPALELLSQRFSSQLEIILVSVDQDDNLVKEFLINYRITMPSYLATAELVKQQLAVTQYPTTLLVSPQGKIVKIYIGAKDWNSPAVTQLMEQYLGA